MRARTVLPLLASLFSSLPLIASAQDTRVYLTPSQVVDEENNRPAEGLDGALLDLSSNATGIVFLTPILNTQGSGDLNTVIQKVEGVKKSGFDKDDKEAAKAVDILKGVVDTYEASMTQVDDFDAYLEALGLLSTAYYVAGYEDEYVDIATKVAALRPDAPPKVTNSDIAKEISNAQTKLKKAAPGILKISIEDGAIVKVDGLDRADYKSMQLPKGVHFVVIVAPGKNPYAEKVKVDPNTPASISPILAPFNSGTSDNTSSLEKAAVSPTAAMIELLKKGTVDSNVRKMAVDLGKKNKADLVVLNIVARDSGQYKAYAYLLRTRDGGLIDLGSQAYTPGPSATLTSPAKFISDAVFKASFDFSKGKQVPGGQVVTIVAKGAAPLATNPINPNPSNPNATKVNPYAVPLSSIPTDAGKDGILTAPPDARGNGAADAVVSGSGRGNGNNSGRGTNNSAVEPPEGNGEEPKGRGGRRGNKGGAETALQPETPRPDKEPRDPISIADITSKKWFWPVVGVVGAGAVGAGVYVIAKPNGLDGTVTWP